MTYRYDQWSERDINIIRPQCQWHCRVLCCLCLKEWALHTGRYREGIDEEDWVSWKTRLRCALNKASDIFECKNENNVKTDDSNPYKVYEFRPRQREYKLNVTSVLSSSTADIYAFISFCCSF